MSFDAERANDRRKRSEEDIVEGFERWLKDSLIQSLLGDLVELGAKRDRVEMLLKKAYSTGYNSGAGFVTIEIMKQMFSGKPEAEPLSVGIGTKNKLN